MAKKEIISAIDIGTTKIVAMIAQKTEDGKFEILGLGNAPSSGVKRGVVVHIDETVSAIELAKEQAEEKAGYRTLKAFNQKNAENKFSKTQEKFSNKLQNTKDRLEFVRSGA